MTEETKKIFSGTEVGVLIEDFESQVKTVSEGVLSLGEKMDRMAGELKGDLKDFIEMEIAPELKEDLQSFIRSELATLRADFRSVRETSADQAKVDALEQRVAALERLVGKEVV